MAKPRRFLNGAAKDAFLKRLLASEPGLDNETRDRLTQVLQSSIASVARRHDLPIASAGNEAVSVAMEPAHEPVAHQVPEASTSSPSEGDAFDPYSPNVIVVFRTRGRDAALEELHSIEDVESLRLLAREQQLGIASDLADAPTIRQAIVAAAERRIANRRAAAS